MDFFDILGINQNSDKKTIKHAYAKLVKKYNPEDDPEGYQRLREAYEQALKYEKSHNVERYNHSSDNYDDIVHNNLYNNNSDDTTNDKADTEQISNDRFNIHNNLNDYINNQTQNTADDINVDFNKKHDIINDYLQNEIENESSEKQESSDIQYNYQLEKKISEFTNKLNEVYCNIQLRSDKNCWRELLNDDVLWNLDTSVKVKGLIIAFICTHRYIPRDAMNEIDNVLKINGNEISNYYTYSREQIDEYMRIYNNADTMKYDYLDDINPIIVDKYLDLRFHMYSMIIGSTHNFSLSEITKTFNDAVKLYDKDAELLMLMASYFIELGYIDSALQMYDKVIIIDRSYAKAYKAAADILFNRQDFKRSSEYMQKYIDLGFDEINDLYTIAHSYYYTKSYENSLKYFELLCSKGYSNRYINKYIKNLKKKVTGSLSGKIKFSIRDFNLYSPVDKTGKSKPVKKYNKYKTIAIIMFLIFSFVNTLAHYNSNKSSRKKEPKNQYSTEKTLDDFKSSPTDTRISLHVSDVEVMDCYAHLGYTNEQKFVTTFMSKQEMINKNYWDHAHGRIYSGKVNGQRVFFECSKNLNPEFKKNTRYIIKGFVSPITPEMFKSLSSFTNTKDDYLSTKYISISPTIKISLDNTDNSNK